MKMKTKTRASSGPFGWCPYHKRYFDADGCLPCDVASGKLSPPSPEYLEWAKSVIPMPAAPKLDARDVALKIFNMNSRRFSTVVEAAASLMKATSLTEAYGNARFNEAFELAASRLKFQQAIDGK